MHHSRIRQWIPEQQEFSEKQSVIAVNDNACESWQYRSPRHTYDR